MKLQIIVNIFYLIIMFVGKTSINKFLNKKIREKYEKEGIPIIYAFWHNRIFYLPYLYRKTHTGVMVSKHKDGEIIAKVMNKLKLKPVRGSTSRGGIRALIEIIRYAQKSKNAIAFTPDGPRGPKYVIQEGVLIAARETGFPIVPIAWNAKRRKELHSWDNFLLPFPFNKFITVYGEPIFIKKTDNLEEKKQKLYTELMRITELSDKYFGTSAV